MRRQLIQNCRTGGGGAGEKHLIHATANGIEASVGRLVQYLQQCGIKTAGDQ